MMPCNDCGTHNSKYYDEYKNLFCFKCYQKRLKLTRKIDWNKFNFLLAQKDSRVFNQSIDYLHSCHFLRLLHTMMKEALRDMRRIEVGPANMRDVNICLMYAIDDVIASATHKDFGHCVCLLFAKMKEIEVPYK